MKQNWEIKKLKDICDKGSSNVNMKDLNDLAGDYPIYGASGLIKKVDFYHQEKEYIGIIKDGSGIGRTMLLPPKSSVIGTLQYILPKEGNLIQFINYALQSLDLTKFKQGAAIPHIYFKDYGETEIVVPPLTDQRRIVDILDAKFVQIDALKAAAQKNLDNAEQLWKAQLEKQFDNQKWEKKKLGEVAKVSSSKRIYAEELSPSGVPFLRVSDVVSRINGTETCDLYIPEEKYLLFFDKGLVPKENDVLVTSRGTLGLCYIIKSTDRFYFQDGMITWLALKNDINPKFIYYLFDSQIIKKQIKTKAAGAAVSYISIADIKNFEIPIPPLAEQERIVKELDALSAKINTLKANYRRQIECCDELRQSLLKKAFEGEL